MKTDWDSSNNGKEGQFVAQAESRHDEQLTQSVPDCLRTLQDDAVDIFYTDWQAFDSLASGDEASADSFWLATDSARENFGKEFDVLADKYNWKFED